MPLFGSCFKYREIFLACAIYSVHCSGHKTIDFCKNFIIALKYKAFEHTGLVPRFLFKGGVGQFTVTIL